MYYDVLDRLEKVSSRPFIHYFIQFYVKSSNYDSCRIAGTWWSDVTHRSQPGPMLYSVTGDTRPMGARKVGRFIQWKLSSVRNSGWRRKWWCGSLKPVWSDVKIQSVSSEIVPIRHTPSWKGLLPVVKTRDFWPLLSPCSVFPRYLRLARPEVCWWSSLIAGQVGPGQLSVKLQQSSRASPCLPVCLTHGATQTTLGHSQD